jgi:cellulose synthase/poly-beta-1,6-N-acetylglucosamine synthase-like glycosyltransferase
MEVFLVVLARDEAGVKKKVLELDRMGYPYVIVCGQKIDNSHVVHREPHGKYDAINFGMQFVPSQTDIVAFNDVDTTIHNFEAAIHAMQNMNASLVFARVDVEQGPQASFYSLLDPIRKRIPVAASGELMLVRYDSLKRILPMKGCKAEDSYILFKVLENGGKVAFCKECSVTTKRTERSSEEEHYKRRTVGGIYQALSMSKPPLIVRLFYTLLPFASPLMFAAGRNGYYWAKGILLGYVDYMRGDRSASWLPYNRNETLACDV